MKIKITKQVEVEDCTEQFISRLYGFLEDYYIAKIDENEYAIVNKENNISLVQFQSIEKITKVIWILNINDNEKMLIDISKPIPTRSKVFSKVIKIYEEYVLVEYENGKRDLVCLKKLNPVRYEAFDPLTYLKLPSGKWSFIDMVNLMASKEEFKLDSEDFI